MTEITESATRPRLDEPNAIDTNVNFCPVIGLVCLEISNAIVGCFSDFILVDLVVAVAKGARLHSGEEMYNVKYR
jgi:hypothetical protein